MFDNSTICPYSGLRSFTEEESIFFKGRDKQIDQITQLLERNKFLMVTGASGEGKSSLVYAGMIPNARAGFFKAKYSNWQVVDFRPERTPLTNLSKALSSALGYENFESVETELQRGYSALVDIYKNSDWHLDDHTVNDEDKEQNLDSRKAANLLIIVDQFEEFFTNPENYSNSSTSVESQTTVNLLLETAKIALDKDIPIYVVCTMRSDYIGQCSAFRGLPEAIGFSQFFVPRLKRNELKLIIEEPAKLNGNSISQRLVERLLYDLSEGIDQLPILQHALSHIWHAANNGAEEMDLVHYALVGGMAGSELPDEDKTRFREVFKAMPDYQRNLYHSPGIKRIIEIHANQLYEGAYTYYRQSNPRSTVSLQDVKNVVALTFACLTKIDDSRAVRNRMTLEEITGIINKPQITAEVVNSIINIFREQDNSFIRPFIKDDASILLNPNAVLDITHESLIRNWDLLNKWANKEYEYYTTYLDFKKQLERWLESGKSKGYLLPIGPLSYFEDWENQCKPNKHWIKRYDSGTDEDQDILSKSEDLLNQSHEFLRSSNRKVLVARTFMKYGANRIAATLAIIVVFFLSAFYFYDAKTKRDSHVINSSISKANTLLGSQDIMLEDKSKYLIMLERRNPGSILSYLDTISNEQMQYNIAISCYEGLLYYDKKFKGTVKKQLQSFFSNYITNPSVSVNELIENLNKLSVLLAYDYYYNNDPAILELIQQTSSSCFESIVESLGGEENLSSGELNKGIQFYLTFNNPSKDKIAEVIDLINPFNQTSVDNFNTLYPKGSFVPNGRTRIDFNGGYHTMASLFASAGNATFLLQSLDSLVLNKDYFTGIAYNNLTNLLGYLYQYNNTDLIGSFLKKASAYSNKNEIEVIQDFFDRSGYMKYLYSSNINTQISESNAGYFGPNLTFIDPELLSQIRKEYNDRLMGIKNTNERNYLAALSYKQEAIILHKYNYDRGIENNKSQLEALLNKAAEHFANVSSIYLNENISVAYRYYGGGPRERSMTRNDVFIYPDIIGGFMSNIYNSPLFINYVFENGLIGSYYKNDSDLKLLDYWLNNFYEVYTFSDEDVYKNDYPLSIDDHLRLSMILSTNGSENFDRNLINIVLANLMFNTGDIDKGLTFYNQLNINTYRNTAGNYEYLNEAFFLNQVRNLAINLAINDFHNEAIGQIESMQRPSHKVLTYLFVANALYSKDFNPLTFDYLDSAYSIDSSIMLREMTRSEDYRSYQAYLLGKIGGQNTEVLLDEVIKSLHEQRKNPALESQINGYAAAGNYYRATSRMHNSLTEAAELRCYTDIIYQESLKNESEDNKELWYGMDSERTHRLNYRYNVRFL